MSSTTTPYHELLLEFPGENISLFDSCRVTEPSTIIGPIARGKWQAQLFYDDLQDTKLVSRILLMHHHQVNHQLVATGNTPRPAWIVYSYAYFESGKCIFSDQDMARYVQRSIRSERRKLLGIRFEQQDVQQFGRHAFMANVTNNKKIQGIEVLYDETEHIVGIEMLFQQSSSTGDDETLSNFSFSEPDQQEQEKIEQYYQLQENVVDADGSGEQEWSDDELESLELDDDNEYDE